MEEDPQSPTGGQGQLCDQCDEFVLFSNILEHLFIHVGPLYLLNCPNPQCPHMFTSYKSLKTHLYGKGHRKIFPMCVKMARETKIMWTCKFKDCGFVADTHPNLRKHLKDIHEMDSSKTKKYECPIDGCEEAFRALQSVLLHLHRHRCPSPHFQDCLICGENLESQLIEEHLKKGHGFDEIYRCVQCPFKFVNRDDLLKHVGERHLDTGILCSLCDDGVKYFNWNVFRTHCHNKHGDPLEMVECEWCEKMFWRKEDAYEHAAAKHKDKDPMGLGHWKCEVEGCGRRFKKRKSWKGHEKCH